MKNCRYAARAARRSFRTYFDLSVVPLVTAASPRLDCAQGAASIAVLAISQTKGS
jgi:hypothetical protein